MVFIEGGGFCEGEDATWGNSDASRSGDDRGSSAKKTKVKMRGVVLPANLDSQGLVF